MALWWELGEIENAESLWETATTDMPSMGIEAGQQYMNNTTYTLIWLLQAVGIPSITPQTARDVYARITFLEKNRGAMRYGPNRSDVFFTIDEIHRHIGLKTNATRQTETEFLKRAKGWLGEYKNEYTTAIIENLLKGEEVSVA